MPTLPLFDWPVRTALASHYVRAPGGYETWRFAAYDPAAQTSIAVRFQYGFACRQYVRRYMRYRARPTRLIPPMPQEYLAVTTSIHVRNHFVTSTVRVEPAKFSASDESGVRFGPYGFSRMEDGAIRLQAPRIDLSFRALFSRDPIEIFLSPTHRWLLTDGLCDIKGDVEIDGTKIPVTGQGFHDQQYGSEPMLDESFSGHLFLKDRAIAFAQGDMIHSATFEANSLPLADVAVTPSPRSRTIWGLSYPRAINLKDGPILDRPRVVHSGPAIARLLYQATWNGETGTALCETRAPHRLSWSIFG